MYVYIYIYNTWEFFDSCFEVYFCENKSTGSARTNYIIKWGQDSSINTTMSSVRFITHKSYAAVYVPCVSDSQAVTEFRICDFHPLDKRHIVCDLLQVTGKRNIYVTGHDRDALNNAVINNILDRFHVLLHTRPTYIFYTRWSICMSTLIISRFSNCSENIIFT